MATNLDRCEHTSLFLDDDGTVWIIDKANRYHSFTSVDAIHSGHPDWPKGLTIDQMGSYRETVNELSNAGLCW